MAEKDQAKKRGARPDDMSEDMSLRIEGPRAFPQAGADRVAAIERKLHGRRKGK